MKKLFVLSAVAVLSVSSVFAQSVMHGLNLSFPQSSRTYDFDDLTYDADAEYSNIHINYNLMTMSRSKFSMILGIGMGSSDGEISANGTTIDGFEGFGMDFKFGCGFAPVNNGRMVLAIHGIAGLNLNSVTETKSPFEYEMWDFGFCAGADVVFGVRFADSFGMMAGLDVTFDLAGTGSVSPKNSSTSTDFSYTGTGVNVVPRIGVCWIK